MEKPTNPIESLVDSAEAYAMDIRSGTDLRAAILQLEAQQAEEAKLLRESFHLAYESIKPINLIKSTFREVAESKDLADHLVSTGVGLATGYLTKVIFESESDSPFKKLLGAALQFGITNLIANNPDAVRIVSTKVREIISSISEALEPEVPADEIETEN